MPADPVHVVTIMNYPPDDLRHGRMCAMFLDSVATHGADRITILYEDHEPRLSRSQFPGVELEIRQGRTFDVGHPFFTLRFKLAYLAALTEPFLFLDADTVVLGDLRELWAKRHAKPWIGIDHQWVPQDERTHRTPFLNSGVQLVSDPRFYDLEKILAVQSAAAPLSRWQEIPKAEMFPCPGADQAVLFRYFQTIGYDYTHPEIGPRWNSCAGVTEIQRDGNRWKGRTIGLPENYDVDLIHYWSQYKPWAIGCPIYGAYGEDSSGVEDHNSNQLHVLR